MTRLEKGRSQNIKIFLLAMLLFATMLACGSSSSGQSSGVSSNERAEVIIPAGELYKYEDNYPTGQDVFVRKKDGTIDPRPNDLEELCKDWLYYRKKIIEAESAGQTDKADEYRATFRQVNAWLDEYNEDDVGTMFTILEEQGYSPP